MGDIVSLAVHLATHGRTDRHRMAAGTTMELVASSMTHVVERKSAEGH